MAIKSNEKITASDINILKSKILTMYNNRPYLTSTQINYAGTAINNTDVDSTTDINQIGDIIDACLVINDIPNLKWVDLRNTNDYINKGEYIFGDGSSTDLLTWLSDTKKNATGTSSNHGCRGSCVGICTATCFSTCAYVCVGNETTEMGATVGNANGGTQTGTNCTSGTCTGKCRGSCREACWQQCNTGCKDSCGSDGCLGGCKATCAPTCSSRCIGNGDSLTVY